MTDQLQHFAQGELTVRADVSQRQIDVRLFRWGVPSVTEDGLEQIERGALDGIDPASIVARMDHLDPPIGRAIALESRSDGPYATLQIVRTPRGDEGLQLAADGIYSGVSVGFTRQAPAEYRTLNGQRLAIRRQLDVREISLTWRPAHIGADILAIRTEGQTQMDTQDQATGAIPSTSAPAVAAAAAAAQAAIPAAPLPAEGAIVNLLERMDARMAALEERARRDVDVPGATPALAVRQLAGRWARAALAALDGDRVPDLEMRALADVVTADNLGVVPAQIRSEILGIIDPARPFLQSTRKVDAGDSGMKQIFPIITQRPSTGVQAAEKDELASQKTIISTVDFDAVTIGGAGDLSLQLLKRSSPAFLQLWLDLLAEQYALDADDGAVAALIDAGATEGAADFDPEAPAFGEAFTNAAAVSRLMMPDRMWLSTAAVALMIDAKSPTGGGGTPLYPGLVGIEGVTGGGGGGPMPIRLTPIHVPALDAGDVAVVIGPSRGFAWAEDGTYQLQADVPSKAGRDVGLAGIIWYMPTYPAAFTTYELGA